MLGKEGMGRQEVVMKELDDNVRKQYNTPKLPFVIGVLGTGVTAEKSPKIKSLSGNEKLRRRWELKITSHRLKATPNTPNSRTTFSKKVGPSIIMSGTQWEAIDRTTTWAAARFLFGWVMHSLVR